MRCAGVVFMVIGVDRKVSKKLIIETGFRVLEIGRGIRKSNK
jgi:hypothetical protein